MQNKIFNPESVIEETEGFSDIPHAALMDFLPQIYEREFPTMDVWKAHFDSISVPYAICKENDRYIDNKTKQERYVTRYTLWKQRRI